MAKQQAEQNGPTEQEERDSMIDIREVALPLWCKLTDAEKLQLGKKLADTLTEVEGLDAEKTDTSKRLTDQIRLKEALASQQKSVLRSGQEIREIPCREYRDYREGVVVVVRRDTGETVERRPMNFEERQVGMHFQG